MLVQKGLHEKVVDIVHVCRDFLVAVSSVRADRGQLQTIECALACQRLALVASRLSVGALGLIFPDNDGQECIMAQPVVVIQIFVTKAQGKQTLLQQIDQWMFDLFRISIIGKTGGELLDKPKPTLDLTQQDPAAIGRDSAPVKASDNFSRPDHLKFERLLVTLCFHETASSVKCKCCVQ